MYVIMGGTGHVGSAVAETLADRGEAVTIVTHSAPSAEHPLRERAEFVRADVADVDSLRSAFRRGERAFLLNPPADPQTDTDAAERASAANIVAALEGSGLEKVVAQSTYGAQPGERIGDLSVLWEFEQALQRQPIPAAINRGAYYLSNWDGFAEMARADGTLPTMFPADLRIPMVAHRDLGRAAAHRLLSPVSDTDIEYVEGPDRYSSADVADAFAQALGREVTLDVTPEGGFEQTFLTWGFSAPAAESYARMTEASIAGGFDLPENPRRGSTTLREYVAALVG